MKVIDIPAPVEWMANDLDAQGRQIEVKKTVTFRKFLEEAIRLNPAFGKDLDGIASYVKIKKILSTFGEGQKSIRFEDAEFKLLDNSKIPAGGWTPDYASAVMQGGFFDALKNAQTVEIPTGK